jgi:hypothetical protein
MSSFTQRTPNLKQVGAIIDVVFTPSMYFIKNMNIPNSEVKALKLSAMIDTGASVTVIRKGLSEVLGINPIGTIAINTPSSTNVICNQFDMQLLFPNKLSIPSIIITEAPMQDQPVQCLIGRDVLQFGILIYNGYDNSFTLSF